LYSAYSSGTLYARSAGYALAPVVSLQSGIKIDKNGGGNGSEGSPWVLTE